MNCHHEVDNSYVMLWQWHHHMWSILPIDMFLSFGCCDFSFSAYAANSFSDLDAYIQKKPNARNIDCRRVALTFLIETTLCRRRHMLHIRLYVVRWRRLHSSKQKNFTNWSRWVISVFVKFYFHVRVCVCNNNDKYNIAEIRWNRFPILFFTFRTDICITRLVA